MSTTPEIRAENQGLERSRRSFQVFDIQRITDKPFQTTYTFEYCGSWIKKNDRDWIKINGSPDIQSGVETFLKELAGKGGK
jgi:hypothetical protein